MKSRMPHTLGWRVGTQKKGKKQPFALPHDMGYHARYTQHAEQKYTSSAAIDFLAKHTQSVKK